ncbi:DUF484 family protein [Cupriavidus taiwanensis]|uniref:DUF484 domain-containing protein n=2 Tax=Cupriavidus taiwanensis TaxID=164546 RepID=B2AG32_CUPTR|nr:DUF484 family protein [Cupriavidus taiwanensis]CAP62731.1 conserved hypothetical protein, DUF484 [Cupriavidus taiwanensis LMG 19424]SOY43724.1 conserved hypothetical protein, DUF484 [Cupriavidus taiwanensis]SOY85206.1 conserved hypothetical protein, DUF484 [Cupriavidus taiwanensis]SOY99830.1 conserved hypothetical protein, DUF484 [Cupriavidus taiwanensis]SOZ02862.1 conserved hypothetical protein, DUF484 [Cupriavidus taiwanensis]
MNAQDVAAYLQSHPEFFEEHAELLAAVQLTSPHSHRAVSLQERQMEILREKNKGLELRLADLVRHGHENDRTQQRLHDWQLRLLAEADSHALPYAVQDGLQQVFDVPAVALRLWDVAEQYAHMEVAQGASEDLRIFAEGLRAPYCGSNSGFEAASLLERDDVTSLAMVTLRVPVRAGEAEAGADVRGAAFGLLVLGSPDPRRFHDGMGTAYLSQIGAVAGAALNRLRD